jgi:hypothetical protein
MDTASVHEKRSIAKRKAGQGKKYFKSLIRTAVDFSELFPLFWAKIVSQKFKVFNLYSLYPMLSPLWELYQHSNFND